MPPESVPSGEAMRTSDRRLSLHLQPLGSGKQAAPLPFEFSQEAKVRVALQNKGKVASVCPVILLVDLLLIFLVRFLYSEMISIVFLLKVRGSSGLDPALRRLFSNCGLPNPEGGLGPSQLSLPTFSTAFRLQIGH